MENEVNEPAPKYNYISPEEYLAAERSRDEKYEYLDGLVIAMSGASLKHGIISSNLSGNIFSFLEGKECRILPADIRISTPDSNAYVYPDASIVCGEPILEDDKFDTLTNPSVIFEILSPSTRGLDKGRKFLLYQSIPSLREYIMIDSREILVQYAQKQADGKWLLETVKKGILFIKTINMQLSLDKIYNGTGL